MAGRSSRRKLERITYEDLISSSGMSGFDALVRTNPEDIQAALQRNPEFSTSISPALASGVEMAGVETTGSVATPVVSGEPVKTLASPAALFNLTTPVVMTPVEAHPVATDPVVTAPVKPTPIPEAPIAKEPPRSHITTAAVTTPTESDPVVATPVDRAAPQFTWKTEDGKLISPSQRVHRIQMAQDALSRTEEAVYDILWGPKNQNGDRCRLVRIGQSELSREARLTAKNAKLAVERLVAKGFVEVAVPANSMQKREATQYRVFSYAAALERMRARDRTHVVRIVSGVFFAVPLSTPVDSLSTPVITHAVDTLTTPVNRQPTPVASAQPTPVATGALSLDIYSDKTTTTEIRQIAQTLREILGTVDDDVARRLLAECRKRVPDATVDEITEFVRQKAEFAIRNRQIRNPSGFLITAVPLCFEGESFQIFRKGREETRRRERAEMERIAGAILGDPESSDDDRNWAHGILGESGGRD